MKKITERLNSRYEFTEELPNLKSGQWKLSGLMKRKK